MRWTIILFILLLTFPHAFADEGFVMRWNHEFKKPVTSVAVMDFDRDWVLDDILVGSVDNGVYGFNENGSWTGEYQAPSSVYAVSSFDYGSKDSRLSGSLTSGVAGSWNNYVYAFWRPYFGHSFSDGIYIWKYNAGGDIYALASGDLDENGYDDEVLVGVGGDGTTNTGKIIALVTTGAEWWTYSTSAPVKTFSTVDIDSDGKRSDVVAGFGKTVVVLKTGNKSSNASSASSLWSFGTGDDVSVVSYADFDDDGEYDDVIIGAGEYVYAVDSQGKLLWKLGLNRSVKSITAPNLNGDENIDYYLVGAGDKIFAVRNSENTGEVLWSFNVVAPFKYHVAADFDGDTILDDLAIITENMLLAYDRSEIFVPDFTVVKSVSKASLTVGETFNVTLRIENQGSGEGDFIRINETVPEEFMVVGSMIPRFLPPIESGEVKVLSYELNSTVNGSYDLPAASVVYWDNYAINYSASSGEVSLNVPNPPFINPTLNATGNLTNTSLLNTSSALVNTTAQGINITLSNSTNSTNTSTGLKETLNATTLLLPNLLITRSASNTRLLTLENFTVDVVIKNLGRGNAVEVDCRDNPPLDFEILGGTFECPKRLGAGETEIFSYTLRAREINASNATLVLPPLSVTYKGAGSDESFEKTAGEIKIEVRSSGGGGRKKLLVGAGVLSILAFAVARKKGLKIGRINGGKIKDLFKKIKPSRAGNKKKSDLVFEKRLIELYLEQKKKGEPLTFEKFEEEFKIGHREAVKIVGDVQKKLRSGLNE